jgi:colicin import membrane protein
VVTPKVIPVPPAPEVIPTTPDADIALERQKQLDQDKLRKAQKQAQLDKLEKLAAEKKTADDKRRADLKKAELKQAELKLAEQKQAEQRQAALAAARKDALRAQEDAKKMEAQRQENMKRMAGLAGATGATTSAGTALQASGPSASYGGRIRARVKPNIVFTEDIAGNPTAEVEVRTSPDGTIIGRKLLKTSGVPAWDEAVLKAIDKTEVLPRDVDGRVPPTLVISFRPKD